MTGPFITFWKKDAVSLRENVRKALEMGEKLPEGVWKEQIKICLANAVKYLAKGVLHENTVKHQSEPSGVGKA